MAKQQSDAKSSSNKQPDVKSSNQQSDPKSSNNQPDGSDAKSSNKQPNKQLFIRIFSQKICPALYDMSLKRDAYSTWEMTFTRYKDHQHTKTIHDALTILHCVDDHFRNCRKKKNNLCVADKDDDGNHRELYELDLDSYNRMNAELDESVERINAAMQKRREDAAMQKRRDESNAALQEGKGGAGRRNPPEVSKQGSDRNARRSQGRSSSSKQPARKSVAYGAVVS
jgi:hypothetical protein